MTLTTKHRSHLLLVALLPVFAALSLPASAEERGSVTHVYKDGRARDFVLQYGPTAMKNTPAPKVLKPVGKRLPTTAVKPIGKQPERCFWQGVERGCKLVKLLQQQAQKEQAAQAQAAADRFARREARREAWRKAEARERKEARKEALQQAIVGVLQGLATRED